MSVQEEERRPDLVGDGHDPIPLLKAEEVANILRVPEKSVYDLPIPRVKVSERRIRWRPSSVEEFIEERTTATA